MPYFPLVIVYALFSRPKADFILFFMNCSLLEKVARMTES